MKTFALNLEPGQDLKEELNKFTKENNIRAGFIMSCAGSLGKVKIRLAGAKTVKEVGGEWEIVSLGGTLSQDGMHVHISISDNKGNTIGGHLKEGCIIRTCAEIVIGEIEDLVFSREFNEKSGFKELKISKI